LQKILCSVIQPLPRPLQANSTTHPLFPWSLIEAGIYVLQTRL
jgi:hypothetical protein